MPLPSDTLAGTALRSIQKDTQDSMTIRVAGKYVCSKKKKMWRRRVKLMYRRLYQPGGHGKKAQHTPQLFSSFIDQVLFWESSGS